MAKTRKPRTCPNLYAAFGGSAWAMRLGKLEQVSAFLELRNSGLVFSAAEVAHKIGTVGEPADMQVVNGVAIIPIEGVISQRVDMLNQISGGTSTEKVGAMFDSAINDETIKAIIFDIDSPGGSSFGVMELADKIYSARGKKPIVSICNSEMASAAYWIGSASDKIYITPSGWIGSVGVYIHHEDYSRAEENAGVRHTFIKAGQHKVDGNYLEPLSSTAKDEIQSKVDQVYSDFLNDLVRFRGKVAARNNFGDGKMFLAKEAVENKMADEIETFESVLTGFQRTFARNRQRAKALMEADILSLEL